MNRFKISLCIALVCVGTIFARSANEIQTLDTAQRNQISGGGGSDLPSLTGHAGDFLKVSAGEAGTEWITLPGGGDALTTDPLSQFAATTSLQLKGVLSDETGSGASVFATSPTLVTPTLGVATATSVNKITLTAPASSATLTLADGKTLTVSNTLTFTGTDASSVNFGTGGTAAYTGGTLAQFAATTSAQLAGVLNNETGSGAAVFDTAPTFSSTVVVTGNATMNGSANTMPNQVYADGTSVMTGTMSDRRAGLIRRTIPFSVDAGNTTSIVSNAAPGRLPGFYNAPGGQSAAYVGGTADSKITGMLIHIMNNGTNNIPAGSLAIGPCNVWGNLNQYMNSNAVILAGTTYTTSNQIYSNMAVTFPLIPTGGYYATNVFFSGGGASLYPADVAAHPSWLIRNIAMQYNGSVGALNGIDLSGCIIIDSTISPP